jgi:hypothetical protein
MIIIRHLSWLCLLALAACRAPSAEPREAQRQLRSPPPARFASRDLGAKTPVQMIDTPSSETLRALKPSPERLANLLKTRRTFTEDPSTPARLVNPIIGARLDLERGERLTNVLASFPEERGAQGVAALTYDQFWDLCEEPMINFELEHEGERYEARHRISQLIVHTAPVVSLYALTSTCTEALLAGGGDLSRAVGAGCAREDEEAHFPAGSTCRSCLAVDGDHARCVRASSCKEQMARELQIGTEFYDVIEAACLACAPDYYDPTFILAHELGPDNAMIDPFDHEAIAHWCYYRWNPSSAEPRLFCRAEVDGINMAVSDVVSTWVDYIRRPGETAPYYLDRVGLVSRIELGDVTIAMMPVFPGALGNLSVSGLIGGWGLNPNLLRPDGTDPQNPDHTQAREWLGAVGLKTATRYDGITIAYFNHNLCSADDWLGPDPSGRYFCRPHFDEQNPPPDDFHGWQHDWGVFADPGGTVVTFPTLTIVSTGRMDTNVPGAHVPKILSSPVLADEQWENCAWPDMFVPDEMAQSDVFDSAQTTFTTQTYRFGRDGDEVRIGMSSNTRRDFCFQAPR